jgi:hypothetical protein
LTEPLLTLKVKPYSKTTLTDIITISNLELEMQHIHSIARYRRNRNKIMVYLIVANNNRPGKINLSILLALLLAKIYNERIHSKGFMCIFSLLIMIVM